MQYYIESDVNIKDIKLMESTREYILIILYSI